MGAGAERQAWVEANRGFARRGVGLARRFHDPQPSEAPFAEAAAPGFAPVFVRHEVDVAVEGQCRKVGAEGQQRLHAHGVPQERLALRRRLKCAQVVRVGGKKRHGDGPGVVQTVAHVLDHHARRLRANMQPRHQLRRAPIYRMRNSAVPDSMARPSSSRTSAIFPARSLRTLFIIFMLSMMHSTSPAATLLPTSTNGGSPGAGAR